MANIVAKPCASMLGKIYTLVAGVSFAVTMGDAETETTSNKILTISRTSPAAFNTTGTAGERKHWICYIRAFCFSVTNKTIHKEYTKQTKGIALVDMFSFMIEHTKLLKKISTETHFESRKTSKQTAYVSVLPPVGPHNEPVTTESNSDGLLSQHHECQMMLIYDLSPDLLGFSIPVKFVEVAIVNIGTRPLGRFISERINEVLPHYLHFYCKQHAFRFFRRLSVTHTDKHVFYVHTFLRVNISILGLQTASHNLTECELDHISIDSILPVKNISFKFCGKHSKTNIFPNSPKVHVTELFKIPLKSKIFQFVYSILEQQKVETLQLSSQICWPNCFPLLSLFWHVDASTYSEYQLRVKHFQHITILVPDFLFPSLRIWDGPGKRSELVRTLSVFGSERVFESSTFAVFMTYYSSIKHIQSKLRFTLQNLGCVPLTVNRQHSVSLPSSLNATPEKATCVSMSTPDNESLEIRFSEYHYTGEINTAQCDWAGASVYSMLTAHTHQFITTECVKVLESHTFEAICTCKNIQYTPYSHVVVKRKTNREFAFPGVKESKIVYSSSDTTKVVWYSFPEFGKFSVQMSFSTTMCKIVTLDAGKFTKMPGHPSRCSTYFPVDTCHILQVLEWPHRTRSDCSNGIEILVGKKNQTNNLLSLSGVGFIEGKCCRSVF